ncbi:MAG: tyrosine-protein phosphatase [Muribaculaceae bacterium]|nr:tyrosine-protein phosphatase [Muribaculaceae bacterium]
MKNQSLLLRVFALLLACPLLMSAQGVTFWNFTDTDLFPSDTLWSTTTLHGVTFVTDGSSADRVPIFQGCSSRSWTSPTDGETMTFTQRMKFNGKSSTAYRWLYFTANPGDTIEVWGNSTSSSSSRTLTLKNGGYNGTSLGDIDLAPGSDVSYGYVVNGGTDEAVIAMISSGSWYTYAIRLKPNPDYDGSGTTPVAQRWFLKHPWASGSWEWHEVYPNEDATLYSRKDIFGGNGCNYADNINGSGSSWVPLSDIELVNNPNVGDSCEFTFNPLTGAISIRNMGESQEETGQRWFFKHGWGDGLDASWQWRELYPNADSTLYTRQDVYGGTGCNYADNVLGINSVWVPLSDLTLIDNPAVGDSAEFAFNPVTKAVSIRLTKAAQQDEVIIEPDPSKAFSLVGGRVYLDNSLAGWDDECIYLVVGNDSESLCVRFLPDAQGRLTCPVPYVKEDITYAAVIGNSHFSSGTWGPSDLSLANHYSAIYSEGWQSGINDGWEISLGAADNGCPITLSHLDGDYGERFTTTEKNNCYRLNDDLRQITFIFSTSRTRFVISPLNLQKLYVYGSISNWSQSDADYQMSGFSADGCFYLTLPYSDIARTGNGGQPEFLFKVYHINGNSYVTQSWPTLAEGCEDYLTFCSNGWKQIVALSDDDIEDLAQRKETALYIRPLADFDLTDRMEQERISNFRLVPGTQYLYRSYHPYHSSRASYDSEHARLEWVAALATQAGINCDIALSGNLESEDGTATYTVAGTTYTTSIPDYYREIINNQRVLYVGTQNGHTPSYDHTLYYTDQSRYAEWIQEIVHFINDEDHPVPFQIHCHLGADRTGVFSGTLAAMCGASWDDIAADYMRTSDMQISEYRHSNQLRYAFYLLTGFDPLILPSGPDAIPTVYTATTLDEAKASHTAYSGGCTLYQYPEEGTLLPTLQDAIIAHFVDGGYLNRGEIETCVAKLRGDSPYPTSVTDIHQDAQMPGVQKVFKDGRMLIIKEGISYDAWGHVVDMK